MERVAPFWCNGVSTLYHADARELPLPDKSVHCIVTSPPYYSLRSYGYAEQIGLEKTPQEFIAELVRVFRECKRVLRDDGVMFCNMGDSYAGAPGNGRGGGERLDGGLPHYSSGNKAGPAGNLLGIPWRLAFALQDDGWILRDEITWAKDSPMPESVAGWVWQRCRVKVASMRSATQPNTVAIGDGRRDNSGGYSNSPVAEYADCPGCAKCAPNGGLVLRKGSWRHTSATESIFMFVKGMGYYSDQEAAREPVVANQHGGGYSPESYGGLATMGGKETCTLGNSAAAGRNPRNIWRLKSEPTNLPHYATFPTSLPTRCIIPSTSEAGVCGKCGSQWARVVEQERRPRGDAFGRKEIGDYDHGQAGSPYLETVSTQTLGFRPTCGCGAPAVPATVLDPFAGTGTTLIAAQRLGRRGIGVDLSEAYLKLAVKRLGAESLPLLAVEPPEQAAMELR